MPPTVPGCCSGGCWCCCGRRSVVVVVGTVRTVGAVGVVTMGTVVAVGTAGAVGAGTVGPTARKHWVQLEFERWVLFRWVRLGLWAPSVLEGRVLLMFERAWVLLKRWAQLERWLLLEWVQSWHCHQWSVQLLLCAPLVVGGVGLVATVGAVGVGGKGRTMGAGLAMMRKSEAGISFRVGAIFALPPVVGAIVAVCALGCRRSGPNCNHRRCRCWRKREDSGCWRSDAQN